MHRYIVRLVGPGVVSGQVSGALLGSVLGTLAEGSRRAVRLLAEGRSTAPGTVPDWLERASDFRFAGVRAGSVQLVLQAPSLAEACPERFGQGDLFDRSLAQRVRRTGLGLFEEAARQIVAGNLRSDLYDDGLVDTVARFADVLGGDVTGVEMGRRDPARIDLAGIAQARELRRRTPAAQRVLVTGKLETIRHSDRMFLLLLPGGEKVQGFIGGADQEAQALSVLWGKQVRVSGTAHFRPSGELGSIEGDRVDLSGAGDAVFSQPPRPIFAELDTVELRRTQTARSGVAAIIGQWPGDETDEEIRQALEDLS